MEQTRTLFNIGAVSIENLPHVTPVSIASSTSHAIEAPLQDKTNENSCVLTYFESGINNSKNDHRAKLINQVMMHYLNEPFFNDLRTTQ